MESTQKTLVFILLLTALSQGCAATQATATPEKAQHTLDTYEGTISDTPMAHLIHVPAKHRIVYVDIPNGGQIVVYVHNEAKFECPRNADGSKPTIRFHGRGITLSGKGKGGQRVHMENQLIATKHECL